MSASVMAQGEFMDKSMSSLVSYCGLYCGDCVIRRGELGSHAGVLLKEMETPEFERLAEGLPVHLDPAPARSGH